MNNNIQKTPNKTGTNISRNITKKSIHTTSTHSGEKVHNFYSVKLIECNFSITEKTINTIKHFIFFCLGITTVIFLYIKPKNISVFLDILKTMCLNLKKLCIYVTPYARDIPNTKFENSLDIATLIVCISTILMIIAFDDFVYETSKTLNFILLIFYVFLCWYANYGIIYLIVKINFWFTFFALLSLIVFNIILFFVVFCILMCIDDFLC